VVRRYEVFSIDQFFQSLYRPDLVRLKLTGMEGVFRKRLAAQKLDLEKVLDSGAAPVPVITSPADGSNLGDSRVTIAAQITSRAGGIGRLEWRVNGVTAGVQTLAGTTAQTGQDVQIQRSLFLGEGTNVVELVAYNSRDLIASPPASIVLTAKSPRSDHKPMLYVLAVGINAYADDALKLQFASADATALATALKQSGAGLYEDIHVRTLLDDEVTSQNLQKTITELGNVVHPDDVFVLYIAGHGVSEDGRYYFIPQNALSADLDSLLTTSIDQDQLQQWLAAIPALRSVLIYDTCESGSTVDDQSGFRRPQQLVAVEKLSRSVGRTVLASTSDTAAAYEGYKGHGIFTYVLLDALAFADQNNDGYIQVSELSRYLVVTVPELTRKLNPNLNPQLPQVKIIGTDFTLVNRASAPEVGTR
jgi:Caspase domain/Bacterial Ig domain